MGAALGFLLGTGMHIAGAELKRKRQMDDTFINMAIENPGAAADPDIQKALKKRASPEIAAFIAHAGQMQQQGLANFPKSPDAGASAAAPSAQPAFPAGTTGTAPSGPSGLTGMTAQPGYGPHASQGDLSDSQTWWQHISDVQNYARQFPGNQRIQDLAKQEIELSTKRAESIEKEREFQQNKSQQQQFHADTEADRAETRQLQQQFKQESAAQRAQAETDRKANNEQMTQLRKENDDTKREVQVQNITKSFDSQRDRILADFGKAPTPAIKARVEGYNASISQFYRKHASAGAPTLLKYSEEPGTMEKWTGGTVGSPAPKVEAAPPVYGNYKGQSGWLDADGNFYSEADAGTH